MAYNIYNDETNAFVKAGLTIEELAENLATSLRAVGIDVVNGLDVAECEGRYPLSYFSLDRYGTELFVASMHDRTIDYAKCATPARYPGKYFLLCDGGNFAAGSERDSVSSVMCHSKPSVGNEARVDIYYIEPKTGLMTRSGELRYHPWSGKIEYDRNPGSRQELRPEIKKENGSSEFMFHLSSSTDGYVRSSLSTVTYSVIVPGTNRSIRFSQIIREQVKFPVQTTGARLDGSYRFSITVPELPDPTYVIPLELRLTYYPNDDHRYWSKPVFGEATDLAPLGPDELNETKPLLDSLIDRRMDADSRRRRRSYYDSADGLTVAYVLYISPAPKGCRMPVGHIVVGICDGEHREYGELAICRLNAKFVINDIYLRVSQPDQNGFSFLRCQSTTMTRIKEMIGDPEILKGTIGNAKNIRNRYAANAAMGATQSEDGTSVSSSVLREIAKLKYGSEFVEWCYRLGYNELAKQVCGKINASGAWNRVTSMSDIIPGYVEGAKSIFTCFGLPKAWGKTVIDVCVSEKGKDFTLEDLAEGIAATQLAWELESAASGGKPSEAAIPQRAADYAAIWKQYVRRFGFCDGGERNDHWLIEAYRGDPIGMAAAFRSYHRMVSKAKRMGIGDWAAENYITETFQAYCTLKDIGEDPKALGVLYEYGLPEDDIDAAREMIRRRTEAAQAVVQSFRDRIDAKARAEIEAKMAKQNDKNRWLECSDPEVCKDYVFKLPTSIYGDDAPLSIEWEGTHQRNCVFNSYPRKLANGEYIVILMRKRKSPDDSYVTIGINKAYNVDQTYGYRDSQIEYAAAVAIKKWMAKVNSRGKGKISFAGRPGGWNPVAVAE